MREAKIERRTLETEITCALRLEGSGRADVASGIGFFDHMLKSWSRFALFDLELKAQGDLEVDAHHTVEDTGIILGEALSAALGDKSGIARVGSALFPMDEALAQVAVDFSGRAHLSWQTPELTGEVGEFPCELAEEFFQALTRSAALTLHVALLAGRNRHHILEAVFKGVGLAMRGAVLVDNRITGVHSTKGTL
jgi:imidazoleglycerol-phosphate dehydratase